MRSLQLVVLTFACVFADFNDTIARSRMLPLSAAAYSDTPQQCLDAQLDGAKLIKQVTVRCDYFHDDCSGFIFVDLKNKVFGISFRGADNPSQMLIDIQESAFEEKVDFKDGGQVSKYFNDAFNSLWNGGLELEVSVLVMSYPRFDLWITGHSLGGALASIASTHIASLGWHDPQRTYVYTFGEPRVGDQKYADLHDNLVPLSYRVVHDKDIVVHSPPPFEKYVHHKYEVFYPNSMKEGAPFTVCAKQEDNKCSDKYVFEASLNDHVVYYGRNVSDYGKKGCV